MITDLNTKQYEGASKSNNRKSLLADKKKLVAEVSRFADIPLEGVLSKFASADHLEKVELLCIYDARVAFATNLSEYFAEHNRVNAKNEGVISRMIKEAPSRSDIETILACEKIRTSPLQIWNTARDVASNMAANPASSKWVDANSDVIALRSEIILRILPKIKKYIVKKFGKKGIDYDVLINESVIGVARALEKYNPNKGRNFIQYALLWASARIYHAFEKNGIINVPAQTYPLKQKISQIHDQISQEIGGVPTEEDIIAHMGITKRAFAATKVSCRSLEEPVERMDDDYLTLGDLLPSDNCDEIHAVDLAAISERIAGVFSTLIGRERDVSLLRLTHAQIFFDDLTPLSPQAALCRIKAEAMRDVDKYISTNAKLPRNFLFSH